MSQPLFGTLLLLLCSCSLLWGSGSLMAQGTWVRRAFTPSSSPDVALHYAQGALRIWGDEIAKHIQGLGGDLATVYPNLEAFSAATREGGADLTVLTSPPLNTGAVLYRWGFSHASRPLTEASLGASRRMYREYLQKQGRLL